MRIAVVSTDGINVDEHFGRAQRFLIYDRDDGLTMVEDRPTGTLSVGDPDHPFDAQRFQDVASQLKDCNRVYVTRIGAGPAARLKQLGIEPVIYQGPIAHIPG